jgi:hypothetical protein
MTFSYRVSAKGHLLLAIEALKFAPEQPAIGAATRRKIAIALASARRDLARLRPESARRTRRVAHIRRRRA